MSCTVYSKVSSADLPGMPLNCDEGKRLCFAAIYESLWAWTHSKTFPSTSKSWISLYDLGSA